MYADEGPMPGMNVPTAEAEHRRFAEELQERRKYASMRIANLERELADMSMLRDMCEGALRHLDPTDSIQEKSYAPPH